MGAIVGGKKGVRVGGKKEGHESAGRRRRVSFKSFLDDGRYRKERDLLAFIFGA